MKQTQNYCSVFLKIKLSRKKNIFMHSITSDGIFCPDLLLLIKDTSYSNVREPNPHLVSQPVADPEGGGHGAMTPPLSLEGALSAPEGTLKCPKERSVSFNKYFGAL